MKSIIIIVLGTLFGIILTKAEIISWYRIYEMFHFQSFHMYGVIGSAVTIGIISLLIIRETNIKNIENKPIIIDKKQPRKYSYLIGGIFFGLGWALIGACPGPIFILIGYGYYSLVIVLIAALFGTFFYGLIKNKLPH